MDLSNIKSEHQLIQDDKNGMEIKFEDDKIHLMNEIEKLNKMINVGENPKKSAILKRSTANECLVVSFFVEFFITA